MAEIDDNEELVIEEEADEEPYVEFDISATPSDSSLELLSQKLSSGEIIIPFYQRKFVWKVEQASKLIESFLMGLPVPQVFFYVNENDVLEVIDGQQRLKSVNYFFEGYFGEPDARGKRTVFRLKGLSERSEYNGLRFEDLSDKDKRRLKNATLRAINIKQLKPSVNNDSVFHIFERLNTGGTRLKAQEIRNAIYRGKIVDELRELNELADWRTILGVPVPDKTQKDMELILRLYSLFEVWGDYEKPMLAYENCVKEVLIGYCGSHSPVFGVFASNQYDRLNSRINLSDLVKYAALFGDQTLQNYKDALGARRKAILDRTGRDICESYDQLLRWRHQYAHAGQQNTTIEEAYASHAFAKRVLYVFSNSLS